MNSQMRRGPLSDLTQYINPDVNNSRVHNAIGSHAFGFQRKATRPDTYKTVMCQAWLESMKCAFGENCKFAHGEHELRPVRTQIRNNLKYKTKLCDKYTTTGICPYGSRCLFIHPAPTKPVHPVQQAAATSVTDKTGALQQQLEMIRQQYGPNSLPDFPAPQIQQLWAPSGFMTTEQTNINMIAQQAHAQFGARRSFSTKSASSSAFGSSNSLGSGGQANWAWSDDLSQASLSPPAPPFGGSGPGAAPAFHNSLPTFSNSHSFMVRSATGLHSPTAAHHLHQHAHRLDMECVLSPMSGTEEQGEQLARSVARALEIDL